MKYRSNQTTYTKGEYYHFFNRGAHREPIFREPTNYEFVTQKLNSYCLSLCLTPLAYCWMPNHYHILVRQDGDQSAGQLPQLIFNSYSKAYNKKYGHSGTLFEGKFSVRHIDQYSHLVHLCRYIHANPVKDGMAERPEDWPYSNYREWIGEGGNGVVDTSFVRRHFGDAKDYKKFVADFLESRKLPQEVDEYLKAME